MANVTIPEELFLKLVKYHLLNQTDLAPDIQHGLEYKLSALVKRQLYAQIGHATTPEDKSAALKKYLDSKPTTADTVPEAEIDNQPDSFF